MNSGQLVRADATEALSAARPVDEARPSQSYGSDDG